MAGNVTIMHQFGSGKLTLDRISHFVFTAFINLACLVRDPINPGKIALTGCVPKPAGRPAHK